MQDKVAALRGALGVALILLAVTSFFWQVARSTVRSKAAVPPTLGLALADVAVANQAWALQAALAFGAAAARLALFTGNGPDDQLPSALSTLVNVGASLLSGWNSLAWLFAIVTLTAPPWEGRILTRGALAWRARLPWLFALATLLCSLALPGQWWRLPDTLLSVACLLVCVFAVGGATVEPVSTARSAWAPLGIAVLLGQVGLAVALWDAPFAGSHSTVTVALQLSTTPAMCIWALAVSLVATTGLASAVRESPEQANLAPLPQH